MAKYKLSLSIGISNARQEEIIDTVSYGYSDADWETWTEEEKEKEIDEIWKDWCGNFIDGGASLIE